MGLLLLPEKEAAAEEEEEPLWRLLLLLPPSAASASEAKADAALLAAAAALDRWNKPWANFAISFSASLSWAQPGKGRTGAAAQAPTAAALLPT
jgi:hypothetical protein